MMFIIQRKNSNLSIDISCFTKMLFLEKRNCLKNCVTLYNIKYEKYFHNITIKMNLNFKIIFML
ncbi:hypothetical protein CNEO2_830034 [Clostridium neonatale]|nr:hypothetical protein CNEO3_1130003 [Clostridium neonatale]CAI3725493.1 hypothetical protein CNEO2_830034 [Clostridium neonatale]